MRIAVIGNQDAVLGFALTGIRGHIANTYEDVVAALESTVQDSGTGIILITEDAAHLARDYVNGLLMRYDTLPLIVEIPGPGGPSPDRPPLNELIQQTIGVQL
jgi:vacuolar-type H+-ATPase subunit F/Vma7